MTTVNYTSFNDSGTTLPKSNGDIDEDISFSTAGVDTTKSGVLSFEVYPSGGTPTLTASINGTDVYSNTFGSSVERVVQENFNQSILTTNNTLTLTVTGTGTVRARDFHVLYKKV